MGVQPPLGSLGPLGTPPCPLCPVPKGTQLLPPRKRGHGPGAAGQELPAFPFSREGLWLRETTQETFLPKQISMKGGFCPKPLPLPLLTWLCFARGFSSHCVPHEGRWREARGSGKTQQRRRNQLFLVFSGGTAFWEVAEWVWDSSPPHCHRTSVRGCHHSWELLCVLTEGFFKAVTVLATSRFQS